MNQVDFDLFTQLDIRVGTIVKAEVFEKAKKPAYKLLIDFGLELGLKKTSAQLTKLYTAETLVGKQIIAIINFKPKQIATFVSECLVLGVMGKDGEVILLTTDSATLNGQSIA
jgi:tRNA-binding protein